MSKYFNRDPLYCVGFERTSVSPKRKYFFHDVKTTKKSLCTLFVLKNAPYNNNAQN